VLEQTAGPSGRSLLESLFGYVASTSGTDASSLFITRSKYTYAFKRAANTPGLIFWKPQTPGQRHKISLDYKALGVFDGPPKPELSMRVPNTGGRAWTGRVTVRGRGGGMKKVLRQVDFARDTSSEGGIVERIEADPNRSGFLALVRYESPDGLAPAHYKYHLAPDGLKVGDVLRAGQNAPIQAGSTLKLKDIPLGVHIHNIELLPGQGGTMARAAGTSGVIQFKEENAIVVRLPSGEIRRLNKNCHATVGVVSNLLRKLTNAGKAGTNRHRGRRPKVRGVAMNPVDHPMGGATAGGRPSCTPWGVYCKGQRTRSRNKWTNRFIVMRKGGQPIAKFQNAKKWRAAAERERKAGTKNKRATPAGPPESLLGPALPDWAQAFRDGGSASRGKQAAASG